MFAAWALNPPEAMPANALPTRFLAVLSFTMAAAVVFYTPSSTSFRMILPATIDFPRPSIQFSADGFLSVQ